MDRRNFLKHALTATAAAATAGVVVSSAQRATQSVLWDFRAPVLDQGKVGSCTGNAVTQWSNSEYARAITKRTDYLTEEDALEVYKLATTLDPYPGSFPPSNTGSDGDAACDAAVRLGYLSGYRNIDPTVSGIVAALRGQPLIVGSYWYSGMMTTDSTGLVEPTGYRSGGHEYTLLGFDLDSGLFTCLNSWSESWGDKGRFHIKFQDLLMLIDRDNKDTLITAPIARDF